MIPQADINMRLVLVFVTILLSGCGTVINSIPKDGLESAEFEMASAAMPPVPAIEEIAESDMPLPSAPSAIELKEDAAFITSHFIEMRAVKPKTKKFIDKVTDSVMSAAEAATSSKKEIITYNSIGEVESTVVELSETSILENLTKIVGFLSATLGLYIGFKKLREPVNTI